MKKYFLIIISLLFCESVKADIPVQGVLRTGGSFKNSGHNSETTNVKVDKAKNIYLYKNKS